MMSGIRLLWADDQADFVNAFRDLASELVGSVQYCGDGESALAAVETFSPDVMLIDLQMPPDEWGGLWLLRELGAVLKYVPTIVVSGQGSLKECIEAQDLGAFSYVEKERIERELPRKLHGAIVRLDAIRASADYVRIRHLERTLYKMVVTLLAEEAERRGDKDIFRSLVPRDIAMATYGRMYDQGFGKQEEFLDLQDLAKLVEQYWGSIPAFGALERVVCPSNRAQRVDWLEQLNEARKLIAHPLWGNLDPNARKSIARAEDIVARWAAMLG
ncbi:response regulator [Sorangium sp. So ce394]|uniref:response regulator n=1 Tax=Sorangium sp. So ce394 TaxID=3133310 RepID=UPI003F5AE29E